MRPEAMLRRAAAASMLLAAGLLAGCADLGYYWQSASGHLGVMRAARPVPQWLDDPATPAALKAKEPHARHERN